MLSEVDEIKKRYNKRKNLPVNRYNFILPNTYMGEQEKERAFIKWIKYAGLEPLENKKLLEIGCGTGGNLLEFIRLGFSPGNLTGNELLNERLIEARKKLPLTLKIMEGNALDIQIENSSFDIVFQSMVFSSILNKEFQNQLAQKMLDLLKPGGGILWYDFIFNNPMNEDVRGISFKRVKELFPDKNIKVWRLTLPPPLSRAVTKMHPKAYSLFNLFPFIRSHILCWIIKS